MQISFSSAVGITIIAAHYFNLPVLTFDPCFADNERSRHRGEVTVGAKRASATLAIGSECRGNATVNLKGVTWHITLWPARHRR